MTIRSIAINGTPIEDLHLVLVDGSPSVSGLNRQREYTAMPGRAGGLLSGTSTVAAKVLRFAMMTDSSIITAAQRNAVLDLARDLFEGPLEVTYVSSSARKIIGVCTMFDGSVITPTFLNIPTTLTVEISCENAAFTDVEPSQLVIGATPVRIPTGTVGHAGRFYITGANTTPFTITYRSVTGRVWGQLSITPSLTTGQRMVIDLASQQIAKVDASNVFTLQPTWDTGSDWFHILPRDANRDMTLWPTLESSVSALFAWRRNWEH